MATRFLRGCWLVMVMTAPLLAADGPGATQPAVDALAFPMPAPDPIERPEFQKRPHPITKAVTSATAMMVRIANDGSMLGMTSDIIASVPAESRSSAVSVANLVTKQAQVGSEMKISFDEAVRAVKMRYPRWEPGRIEFSFGEKYTPHDGGSAGTCFAVMLLSELEGFDIDKKCAVTGDITVDWKVRKIGGVAAKLRGAAADRCVYAAIPEDNADQIADMILLYGDASVRDLQVFSIGTLQDAVRVLRTDRDPRLAEAIKQFAELQPKMKAGRATLNNPAVKKGLQAVVDLAPNHESAKALLQLSAGTLPKTLSARVAMESLFIAINPYKEVVVGSESISRDSVSQAMTVAARKQLNTLRPITPKEILPLLSDASAIVETAESIATKQAAPSQFKQRRDTFMNHLDALKSDKDLIEKLLRQGS